MTYLVPPHRQPEPLSALDEAFCVEYVLRGCTGAAKALNNAMLALDPRLDEKQALPSHTQLQQRAYRMLRDPVVLARIREMREQAASDARFSLMDHITRLEHLSLLAEAQGEVKVALAAEIARGKAAGYQRDNAPVLIPNTGGEAAQPVDPNTGKPNTVIQQAVFIQSMSPKDASLAYQRLMSGMPLPEIQPRVVTTIQHNEGNAAEMLVIE